MPPTFWHEHLRRNVFDLSASTQGQVFVAAGTSGAYRERRSLEWGVLTAWQYIQIGHMTMGGFFSPPFISEFAEVWLWVLGLLVPVPALRLLGPRWMQESIARSPWGWARGSWLAVPVFLSIGEVLGAVRIPVPFNLTAIASLPVLLLFFHLVRPNLKVIAALLILGIALLAFPMLAVFPLFAIQLLADEFVLAMPLAWAVSAGPAYIWAWSATGRHIAAVAIVLANAALWLLLALGVIAALV